MDNRALPLHALPYSVRIADGLDVQTGTDEGGAAFVRHDPQDVAASIERSGVNSLTPQFPVAIAEGENLPLYRHACQRLMRVWLKYATSDLVQFPACEHDARLIAEHLAAQEIGRGLYENETRVLAEAVRDTLTAQFVMRDLEIEDLRERLRTPGRLFA